MPLLRPPVCCRLHDDLRGQVRAGAGRDPEPTAVIDSQSVRRRRRRAARGRGLGIRLVNGRKRHGAVDALGLIITIVATAASVRSAPPPGH